MMTRTEEENTLSDFWRGVLERGDDQDEVLDYMIERYLKIGGDPDMLLKQNEVTKCSQEQ